MGEGDGPGHLSWQQQLFLWLRPGDNSDGISQRRCHLYWRHVDDLGSGAAIWHAGRFSGGHDFEGALIWTAVNTKLVRLFMRSQ